MSKIYVVMESGGDYDDYRSHPIAASLNQNEAEQYAQKLTEHQDIDIYRQKAKNAFYLEFKKTCPIPESSLPDVDYEAWGKLDKNNTELEQALFVLASNAYEADCDRLEMAWAHEHWKNVYFQFCEEQGFPYNRDNFNYTDSVGDDCEYYTWQSYSIKEIDQI